MTPDEALELVRQGEGQKVEFKQSIAEEKRAIESLCAFINTEGGAVFFGVSPDGSISGTAIGANRLDRFSNNIRAGTDPPLSPIIDRLALEEKEVVAVTVPRHAPGELFYAFNVPLVRVGATNQRMSSEEQRARLMEGQEDWSEERDRPHFEVTRSGLTGLETEFVPEFNVKQFSGDPVANLDCRIRGPRFGGQWQSATGSALDRTRFKAAFDLSASPRSDDAIGLNEMGFEIRFHWRGRWRTELHRWSITRRKLPHKVLWDVGREILPPIETNEPSAP